MIAGQLIVRDQNNEILFSTNDVTWNILDSFVFDYTSTTKFYKTYDEQIVKMYSEFKAYSVPLESIFPNVNSTKPSVTMSMKKIKNKYRLHSINVAKPSNFNGSKVLKSLIIVLAR